MVMSEAKLSICMLKDIANFETVTTKIKEIRFEDPSCNDLLEVMDDMYNKLGYMNIDRVSLIGYFDRVKLDTEKQAKILSVFDMLQNITKSTVDGFDFEGVFEEYSMISSTYKFYNWVVGAGGIDEVANKLLKLKNMEQINQVIEGRLLEFFNTGTADASIQDTDITSTMDDEFIKSIENKEAPLETTPLLSQFYLMNRITKGMIRGTTGFGAHTGVGKAQPLYSKILTPNGFINMGDVRLGEDVFGEDGKIHKVVGIYPQGVKKNYRVTLSDGTCVECCNEHLWEVSVRGHRGRVNKVMSLQTIMDRGLKSGKEFNFRLPITKPIEFNNVETFIDPYLLGVLIGDGCLTLKSTPEFSNTELDIITKVESLVLENGYRINKHKGTNSYTISKQNSNVPNEYMTEIKRLNLNVRSEDKHIPKEYLYNSVDNRLKLLRGLFDTDGCVQGARKMMFTTSNQLKDDIVWLCQSLGMVASVSEDRNKGNDRCYKIAIKCIDSMLPFTSEKHKNRYVTKDRREGVLRSIVGIEYIGDTPMQCIKVSNPSSLYITDNFIVTHNTSAMYSIFVMSVLENSKSKVCIFCNEQTAKVFTIGMVFAFLSQVFNRNEDLYNKVGGQIKLSRDKYISNSFDDNEIKKFVYAIKQFRNRYKGRITHSYFEDMTPNSLRREIRKKVRSGHKYFFYDTFKDPDEDYAKLMKLATVFDQQTKKYPIHAFCSLQLSDESLGVKYLTHKCLASARGTKRVMDTLYLMRKLEPEELATLTVHKLGHPEQTIAINLQSKNYYAMFIDKNRNGTTDVVLLFEIYLDILYYKEIGIVAGLPKEDFKKPYVKKK